MLDFLVARFLYRLSDLIKLFEGENYRSKAFFKAALAIDGYGKNLYDTYKKGELKSIPSIGSKIENYLIEILETGKLSALNELQGELPDSIFDIIDLPQLNYKIIKKIIDNGIYTLNDLKSLFTDNNEMQEMGFKKSEVQKILHSLNQHESNHGKFQLGHTFCIATEIVEWMKDQSSISRINVTGEVRVRDEQISVIHIILSVKNHVNIYPLLKQCHALFDVKTSDYKEFVAKSYLDIPVRISQAKEEYYYLELLKSTGPEGFVKRMLDGRPDYKTITFGCNSEHELFEKLDISYVIPEIRYRYVKGRIPTKNNIVSMDDFKGDLHIHTNWSDGLDSLENMVRKARDMGFKYLAVTDHSSSLKIANGLSVETLLRQVKIIRKMNQGFNDFKILAGAEVDIKKDGTLDYPDYVLAQLDFVIAAIHSGFSQPQDQMMKRINKALTNRFVNVFAHPTGRLLGKPGRIFEKRPEINIDFNEYNANKTIRGNINSNARFIVINSLLQIIVQINIINIYRINI